MFIVSKRGCTVSRPGRHIQIVTLQTWAQSLKKHTHTTHNPIFFFFKKNLTPKKDVQVYCPKKEDVQSLAQVDRDSNSYTSHLKRMYSLLP